MILYITWKIIDDEMFRQQSVGKMQINDDDQQNNEVFKITNRKLEHKKVVIILQQTSIRLKMEMITIVLPRMPKVTITTLKI